MHEEFLGKVAKIYERHGDRFCKPTIIPTTNFLGVYGCFTRRDLIGIAEEVLELEGFTIIRAVAKKSVIKQIAEA